MGGLLIGRLAMVSLALLAGVVPSAHGQERKPPPVGDERVLMLAGIHKTYPTIPNDVAGLMADARRMLDEQTRCELAEWLSQSPSGAIAAVTARAKTGLPICTLAIDDVTIETAKARLGDRSLGFDVANGVITIFAHSADQTVQVCCSLQGALTRIGTSDYWVSRRRLAQSDEAIVSLSILPPPGQRLAEPQVYRGPKAPPAPSVVPKLAGQILERQLKSTALGETRKLQIYLPPGWSKDRAWPALFLADGAAGAYAPMVEQMINEGTIAPIVLVSALSGANGVVGDPPKAYGVDLRSAEYIRNFPEAKDRFDQHMAFFSGELVDYAVSEFNVSKRREDHAVAGFSNGGVLSLWAGLLHPDVFSMAVPMSPGVAPVTPADLTPEPRARFWMGGGLYEPNFQQTAKSAAQALKDAGYQVSGRYLVAGHDPTQWDIVLHDALIEMFPAPKPATAPRA